MIAISSMVKKPFNFDFWLEYHFSLEIDYIFLRIEDSPEILELCKKYGSRIIIESSVSPKLNWPESSFEQMERQITFVNKTIQNCVKMNIDWLLHIDSDELLWISQPLKNILSTVDKSANFAHIRNYEALLPKSDCENPFVEISQFTRKKYLAYANGKSIGRVSKDSFIKGVHTFDGKQYNIPPTQALVLHYESANFDLWLKKFSIKSDIKITESSLAVLNFEFYRKSILLIQDGDLDACKSYFEQMKLTENHEGEIMKLFWTPTLKEKNSTWTIQ